MLIYDEINKEYYNVIPVKKIEEFIEKELPDDEICECCNIYDVNGIEIKKALQQLIKENTEED